MGLAKASLRAVCKHSDLTTVSYLEVESSRSCNNRVVMGAGSKLPGRCPAALQAE